MPKPIARVMLVALAASLSSPAAAGTEPTMEAPTQPPIGSAVAPEVSPSREAGVFLGQLTLGPLVALTPVALAVAHQDPNSSDGEELLAASVLLAPAVAGLTVCALGAFSAYEGSCLASVGGAYLGGVLGGLAAYYMVGYDEYYPPGQAIAAIVGSIAGTTVGSMIGWHVSRKPRTRPPATGTERTPPPTAAMPESAMAGPELRRRTSASLTAPGEARVIFPVLALSF